MFHLRRILHAYPPSRSLSLTDSRLSDACLEQLQFVFGGTNGPSVDLMAHPSNAMQDFTEAKLPLFSPHPIPGCHGVNLFSQSPCPHPPLLFSNPYVSPPICLISNVLRFLFSVRVPFTLVWFRMFSLIVFGGRSFPIVLCPVCFSHERVRLVLCPYPLRADFRISALSLGICGCFVSTISKKC